jgi:ComF family protein
LRHLCLLLKRRANAWLARWLADLLVVARGEAFGTLAGAKVVPVPLHWRRRLGRGYDQADALAHRLARGLRLRPCRALRRLRATTTLARLGRAERLEVMRDAFGVRRRVSLKGETVLLVDDILTTGATTGAAARALKKAGAARVVVAVIGRAEGRA